ncbi:aminotransferase class IV [Paracoccus haematequi]|nr:aminotransferase class IV [Paracoccus haematequi]
MRAEPDGRVQLWPLHLDRLRRDCAAVGFPLDEGRVSAVLAGLPRGQVLRARLTVDAAGAVALTHQPLAANPPLWLLRIADVRLSSSDPWLRIKTSHRPGYDAARAALPGAVDEALLLNERGEICEGTITTLFLEREGRLLTPALDCGLLPGVLRASLLASGRAREAVLRPDDLEDGRILMGNALRGLIPARLS